MRTSRRGLQLVSTHNRLTLKRFELVAHGVMIVMPERISAFMVVNCSKESMRIDDVMKKDGSDAVLCTFNSHGLFFERVHQCNTASQ